MGGVPRPFPSFVSREESPPVNPAPASCRLPASRHEQACRSVNTNESESPEFKRGKIIRLLDFSGADTMSGRV